MEDFQACTSLGEAEGTCSVHNNVLPWKAQRMDAAAKVLWEGSRAAGEVIMEPRQSNTLRGHGGQQLCVAQYSPQNSAQ